MAFEVPLISLSQVLEPASATLLATAGLMLAHRRRRLWSLMGMGLRRIIVEADHPL